VHANSTNSFQGGDMKLIQLGRSACQAETDGYANLWATGMVQPHITDYDAAAVLQTGATTYLCPPDPGSSPALAMPRLGKAASPIGSETHGGARRSRRTTNTSSNLI
jgi:hypothetical protein